MGNMLKEFITYLIIFLIIKQCITEKSIFKQFYIILSLIDLTKVYFNYLLYFPVP